MGTLINALAVIAGSLAGMIFKRGINEKLREMIMRALGLSTIFIGISGALSEILVFKDGRFSTQGLLLICISLGIGTLAGELLKIEQGMEKLGDSIKKIKLFKGSSDFTEGFVSATLVFCVGAMAIVGPIKDALYSDTSVLFTKSVLDFTSSMIFASALGVGVMLAVIPLVLYQGAFTVFAGAVEPYLYTLGDGSLVSDVSMVGSVLICGVGINLLFGKRLNVGNMTPALLVPVVYAFLQTLFLK